MESPPSSSSWSQAFILSDDSGLLLTNGSFSSGSASFESRGEKKHFHFEDSDCEERSLSQDESLDGMSDIICGQNFNTLKKGPHWTELKQSTSPIEPPLEFQDTPKIELEYSPMIKFFSNKLTSQILHKALLDFQNDRINARIRTIHQALLESPRPLPPPPLPSRTPNHRLSPRSRPDFPPFSPCHTPSYSSHISYVSHASYSTPRPSSRSSLGGSSRLSSSHNSLSVSHARKVDDSSFITQAVSHDTLSSNQISDLYNVPFDSDVYAVPVDVVKPPLKPKRGVVCNMGAGFHYMAGIKKRRKNTTTLDCKEGEARGCVAEGRSQAQGKGINLYGRRSVARTEQSHWSFQSETKRHSVAGTSTTQGNEPIHMTLQEVRNYLQTFYSSSSDSSDTKDNIYRSKSGNNTGFVVNNININNNNVGNNKYHLKSLGSIGNSQTPNRPKKSTFLINIKNKKVKDSCDNPKTLTISPVKKEDKKRKIFSFKQALCNIFRFRKFLSVEEKNETEKHDKFERIHHYEVGNNQCNGEELRMSLSGRALPPLPKKEEETNDEEQALDFATSIQRVKDYGWYWGPISSEAAEKILSNEPDGSFIVRDSSDDHYIFSLTFKLNNSIRHVRIEHDQGNFSFGSCTKFKSQTIVEFIENAVEHSRSGRYLFFLHRRPVIGPVRVQLLHPVSRFKQVQSLQHMCRFVIHKNVRRDLIPDLPLPRRMIDYLNTPHYYSEHFIDIGETYEENNRNSDPSPPSEGSTILHSFLPTSNNNFSSNLNLIDNVRNITVNDNSHPLVPANEYFVLSNESSNHGSSFRHTRTVELVNANNEQS